MPEQRDPLARPSRNEPCWCGTGKKYKNCHGAMRPRSLPGEQVPPDDDQQFWLSPTVTLARGATRTAAAGAHMYPGEAAGEPRRLPLPPILRQQLQEEHLVFPEALSTLGFRRFEALAALGLELDESGIYANGLDPSELTQFGLDHAVEVTVSLQRLKFQSEPPAVIYSSWQEIPDSVLHCGLWASHIVVPDPLFEAIVEERGIYAIEDALKELYRYRPLIESGLLVPIPAEFVGAIASESALNSTRRDLERDALRRWVDQQIIVEGPTAREVLFFTARDDLEEWPIMKTLGRPMEFNDDGTFWSMMLQPYRVGFDYSPWIGQERIASVRYYIQDVNEKVAQADFFGASYVTRSLFRANLLEIRSRAHSREQALMWTEAPITSGADPNTFARVAGENEAIADYRRKMGRALRRASSLGEAAESAHDLHEELAEDAVKLGQRLHNSGLWLTLGATLGVGSVAASGTPFDWVLAGLGGASAMKDILPYFEKRRESRLEASWIWYSFQRRERRNRR